MITTGDKIIGKKDTVRNRVHIFFSYRQLDFRSQPRSCLANLENELETELTLPAKTCLNDSSWSEVSFGTKRSLRKQLS